MFDAEPSDCLKLVMSTIVLTLLLAVPPPSVSIQWKMPYMSEEEFDAGKGNTPGSASWDAKSGCAMLNLVRNGQREVVWIDGKQQRLVSIGAGYLTSQQSDCGLGLAMVHRFDKTSHTEFSDFYELSSGKLKSSVKGRAERVGLLVITYNGAKDTTYTDALTGRKLFDRNVRDKGTGNLSPQFRSPIWITKSRWLFLVGKPGQPNSDSKDVAEIDPNTLLVKQCAHLSDVARGFDKIVGNPELGAFAIFESSNRSRECTGVFQKDLTRIPGLFFYVSDITEHGILHRGFIPNEYTDPTFKSVICADIKTGNTKWTVPTSASGRWIGEDVLISNSIYDGETGEFRGRIELPQILSLGSDGSFLGIDGRMLIGGKIIAR